MQRIGRFLLFAFFVFSATSAMAQGQNFSGGPTSGTGAPSGTCIAGALYTNNSNGTVYSCNAGTWAAISSGSNGVSNQSTDGIPYNSDGTSTHINAVVAAPTINGVYQLIESVTASAAVAPTLTQVGLTQDQAAGAMVLYSDNNIPIYAPAAALALPTPTTLGNSNFFTVLVTNGTASTVTPAGGWTISLNGATAGSSAVCPAYSRCSITVDQVTSTQWDMNTNPATATAINTAIQGLTGCNTATYVYTPQGADCVAPSSGSFMITGSINGVSSSVLAGDYSDLTGSSYHGSYVAGSPMVSSRTVSNLYVTQPGNIAAGSSFTVTLYKNNVATALTCTVPASINTCHDTTDSFTVVANDILDYVFAVTGTNAALYFGLSIQLQ